MTENVPDAAVQTITYKRQAHKRKRADLLAALPAEEVHHELVKRISKKRAMSSVSRIRTLSCSLF